MWSAAILAGGRARRLGGQDKSALIVDGVRLLDRQIAVLRPLTDTILLVGYPGPAPASCTAVADHRPGTGPLGAVSTALSAAPTERVLILATDLPFLTTEFLSFLARADENADAVVPVSGGQWQPLCAMYHRRVRPMLDAAIDRGELAVHAAIARLNPLLIADDRLAPFDPERRLFANINTPDDLRHWRASSGRNRTAAPEASQTTSR
jgi:molybdopterin-guanine dinucleotide biosynthesis protein A